MRLFLALPLPEAVRDGAGALVRRLALDPAAWREAPQAGLHLTLRFLGEVAPERRAADDPSWRSAVAPFPPIPLEAAGCGVFPHAARPRVVWLGLRDLSGAGALAALAAALERNAVDLGFAPEPRPFVPHVTLARARERARRPAVRLPEAPAIGAFVARSVGLFRSEIGPGGPRYFEEASYPLEGA